MTTYFALELYRLKRADITLISLNKQQFQDETTMLEKEARRARLKVKKMKISARNQDKIVVSEKDVEEVY